MSAGEVVIDHTPKYERTSGRVAPLAARGASLNTIAAALGQPWETVDQALSFVHTGRRPKTKPPGKRSGTRAGPPQYVCLAAEVVRLRDEKKVSFEKIAARKGASVSTVPRAYDRGRPEAVREAAEQGQRPQRGHYARHDTDKSGEG